jgi:hypothetical protein
MKIKDKKTKKTIEPYVACPRCKIDNTGGEMVPCPRGSCEAQVVGKIITTVEIVVTKKEI